VVPVEIALAKPFASIVATVGSEELQVAWGDISRLLSSLKWPMALNWSVVPTGIVGFPGVINIPVSLSS
jgi:hypothetical protein